MLMVERTVMLNGGDLQDLVNDSVVIQQLNAMLVAQYIAYAFVTRLSAVLKYEMSQREQRQTQIAMQ